MRRSIASTLGLAMVFALFLSSTSAAAPPYDEPMIVVELEHERGVEVWISLAIVAGDGNQDAAREDFESARVGPGFHQVALSRCGNWDSWEALDGFNLEIPHSMFSATERFGEGPYEVWLLMGQCLLDPDGNRVDPTLETDPSVSFTLTFAAFDEGGGTPSSTKTVSGELAAEIRDGFFFPHPGEPVHSFTVALLPPSQNRDPRIRGMAATPDQPAEGDDVTVTVDADDPDGDPLHYQWIVNGLGVEATGATMTLSRPGPGEHTVAVIVTDGVGGSADRSLQIDVTPAAPIEGQPGQPDEPGSGQEPGQAVASDDAAEPGVADGADMGDGADAESADSQATPPPTSTPKRWPITVWLVLFLGVALGGVGVWIALKGVILLRGRRGMNPLLTTPAEVARSVEKAWQKDVNDPDPTFIEYEADRSEARQRRMEQAAAGAATGPAPPPVEAPPPPPLDEVASSPSLPPPFEPAHEIVLGDEVEYNRVPAVHDTSGAVTLLDPGTKVQVVADKGDYLLVRHSRGEGPKRVHKSGVRPLGG